MPQIALAQVVDDEFVTYSFPQGWVVERIGDGVTATPSADTFSRSGSVQTCKRASATTCPETCDSEQLRRNFFYFFKDQPAASYSAPARGDGFSELRGAGPYGDSWIAASVLCGPVGVVYIGATSESSLADAIEHLAETVASVRLLVPNALPAK
jgi:hypothetical protein